MSPRPLLLAAVVLGCHASSPRAPASAETCGFEEARHDVLSCPKGEGAVPDADELQRRANVAVDRGGAPTGSGPRDLTEEERSILELSKRGRCTRPKDEAAYLYLVGWLHRRAQQWDRAAAAFEAVAAMPLGERTFFAADFWLDALHRKHCPTALRAAVSSLLATHCVAPETVAERDRCDRWSSLRDRLAKKP